MKSPILIFTIIFASACVYSQQPPQRDASVLSITLSEYTQEDGTSLKSTIPLDTFLQTPEWNGRGEPPLSLANAIAIATISAKERYPDYSGFELSMVNLSNYSTDDLQNKRWVYGCNFVAAGTPNSNQPFELVEIFVLMDGTIASRPK